MSTLLPPVAGLGFVGFAVWTVQRQAAALSLLFLAFSPWAMRREGPFGVRLEHRRNLRGQQVGFDLLLAVVCTGTIGLPAMVAQLRYLRERSTRG